MPTNNNFPRMPYDTKGARNVVVTENVSHRFHNECGTIFTYCNNLLVGRMKARDGGGMRPYAVSVSEIIAVHIRHASADERANIRRMLDERER